MPARSTTVAKFLPGPLAWFALLLRTAAHRSVQALTTTDDRGDAPRQDLLAEIRADGADAQARGPNACRPGKATIGGQIREAVPRLRDRIAVWGSPRPQLRTARRGQRDLGAVEQRRHGSPQLGGVLGTVGQGEQRRA